MGGCSSIIRTADFKGVEFEVVVLSFDDMC
jgi:hypothetical protein